MWKHFENVKMGSRKGKKELTSITLGNDVLTGVRKAKDKRKKTVQNTIGIWISNSETTCLIGLIK